jgi:hypothetical protein
MHTLEDVLGRWSSEKPAEIVPPVPCEVSADYVRRLYGAPELRDDLYLAATVIRREAYLTTIRVRHQKLTFDTDEVRLPLGDPALLREVT